MTDTPLVKINIDPPERIAELYGIGLVLAERIATYREAKGYFQTPEDLAQVEDVGWDLAIILAPHIDWGTPVIPNAPKERAWWGILLALLISYYLFQYMIQNVIPAILASIRDYQSGILSIWTDIWINMSIFAACVLGLLGATTMSVEAWTNSNDTARRFSNLTYKILGGVVLSLVSMGLGIFFDFQLYTQVGWESYWTNPARLAGLLMFITISMFSLPPLLVLWRFELYTNKLLANIYNIFWIINAPVTAYLIWNTRNNDFSVGYIMLVGLLGIGIGYFGIHILRTGESVFYLTIQNILNPDMLQRVADTRNWQAWINARLPDPEQQKALKKALDETYPPSKWRNLSGAIILGAGGWIMLTALGGVVQWLVEKGLNNLFP